MRATRREALTLLLGAPLAARACKSRRRPVPGTLHGQTVSIGHRLRDATVERAGGEPKRTGTAIVGAGPSGLSAAWRLERAGVHDFTVFELEARAGGTSAYGTDGATPHPWGAHYLPAPRADHIATVKLLEEVGALAGRDEHGEPVVREELLIREPEERLFVAGSWHPGLFPTALAGPEDRAELVRFEREVAGWVRWRDARGRRAFAIPSVRCSDDAEVTALDRISAARWLDDRGYRSPLVRWYLEYATRDDYGMTLAQTSAWALLFYFCARVPKPGAESAPFIAWPEGNGRLVRHLASVAGQRLRLRQLVTDIVPGEAGVELSVFDGAAGTLTRWRAERLIVAIPKFILPRILRPWREQRPDFADAHGYGVWTVANVHVRSQPRGEGFGPAWDNVIYDSPALGYVVASHQQHRDYGPSVWTWYLPHTDDDPDIARRRLLELEHADIADAVLSDLRPAHPDIDDVVERVDAWRWGHAMIRPVPGFRWGSARRRAIEPLGRVHFAHSDSSGLALFEEAAHHGIRAAEEVLRAGGREVSSWAG